MRSWIASCGTDRERAGMATGARGKGRPKLTEAAEIDRTIREAALKELLEHGEGATMHAVANSAGLSRKSLYARYPNKTQLFQEVIRELLTGVRGLEYDTSGNAEERLLHYIEAALGVISRQQSQALQRLLTMDPVYLAALRTDLLAASHKLFFAPLQTLLSEAKERSELAVEDVHATTLALMRLIFSESIALGNDEAPTEPRVYAAFLTKLITRGLLPRT